MKFIATADWQLGMVAGTLDEDARPRFTEARFEVITRIGDLARERGAEFIVVCGDVFETNQLDRAVLSRTFEALRQIAVPVVLVPGNHDPLDSASIYEAPEFRSRVPENVHVVQDHAPIRITETAEVVGVPWFSKRPDADLVAVASADLEAPPPGVFRVIAAHGAVASLNPDAADPATIDDRALAETLAAGLAHVAVLGDRHSTTHVAPAIWYPGTPEVAARRETDPGNVLVIDVTTGAATEVTTGAATHVDSAVRESTGSVTLHVEPVHVGRWTFTTVAATINGDSDVERLRSQLDALPDKSRTAVWLQLHGSASTSTHARLESLLDELRDVFAKLNIWQSHSDLAVRADGADFSDLALNGFAADALEELIERAGAEHIDRAGAQNLHGTGQTNTTPTARAIQGAENGQTAQDALALLYRLAGGAR